MRRSEELFSARPLNPWHHQQMEGESKYPPAPWHLSGFAVARVQFLPAVGVRIPPELEVVKVWPGRTLGGIYLARYGPGSTLEYSELIVFSALARAGGRIGGWVSQIYVDSTESMAGGREIWGLPKELAEFDWGSDSATVRQGETTILNVTFRRPIIVLPVRGPLPAFGYKDDHILHFSGRCRARIGRSHAQWNIPLESPLAGIGLGKGWSVQLSELKVSVPSPHPVTVRSTIGDQTIRG